MTSIYEYAPEFVNVVFELTALPLRFENISLNALIERGLDESFLPLYSGSGLRENYWARMLTNTDYTLGNVHLAGWSSYADRSRAQGSYSYSDEDSCDGWSSDEDGGYDTD